jgi:hypothetical protein
MSETKQVTFDGKSATLTVTGSKWTITGEGINESGDSFFTLAPLVESKKLVLPHGLFAGRRKTRKSRARKTRRYRK